jgi:predicted dehydrogenase
MTKPIALPPDKSVRVALVGCGAIAVGMHLPALAAASGIEVTAFCDRRREQAEAARRLLGNKAAVVSDPKDLAGLADAAIVAVPSRLHAPVSITLLELGLDVLCEKPIAATVADAAAMVRAARHCDRLLAVGLVSRFNGNNRLFRRLLADHAAGEIREVVVEWGTVLDWDMTSDSYFNKATTGGGVLFDMGIHAVDRVVWQFGTLTDIEYEDDSVGGVECNARLRGTLVIESRPVPCLMEFSWTHSMPGRLLIVGSEATVEIPIAEPDTLAITRMVGGEPVRFDTIVKPPTGNAFLRQIEDFASAVRHRREPFVTGESAAESLSVVERAYAVRRRMSQPWVDAIGPLA